MNRERIEAFFQWLAGALFEGKLDWVDRVYSYPLALFINNTTRVEHGPDQTRAYITERRAEIRKHGVSSVTARVLDIGPATRTGYRVEVETRFLDKSGETVAMNRARFLCRDTEDERIKIQSVELVSLDLSQPKQPLMRHIH